MYRLVLIDAGRKKVPEPWCECAAGGEIRVGHPHLCFLSAEGEMKLEEAGRSVFQSKGERH